jgi:hypothetical protein
MGPKYLNCFTVICVHTKQYKVPEDDQRESKHVALINAKILVVFMVSVCLFRKKYYLILGVQVSHSKCVLLGLHSV